MANAMRLAAMMKISVTYVLTHDSCGLGEDGPTHQPVEHLSILRNTPGLSLWHPASLLETAVAWQMSLQSGPSALALSRQKLYPLAHHAGDENKIKQGAYVLYETGPECEVIIFSCGSEVAEVMEISMKLSEYRISEGCLRSLYGFVFQTKPRISSVHCGSADQKPYCL